jgi:hypothetical protein
MGMSPADDVTLLSRKAQAAIAAELQTGERVLLTLGGNSGGAIVLTDRRAAVWNNNTLRSWSLDELSGISFESGMIWSYVALNGPEIQEKKIGLADIASAPHAIQIADKGRARFIVDAAQRLIGNPPARLEGPAGRGRPSGEGMNGAVMIVKGAGGRITLFDEWIIIKHEGFLGLTKGIYKGDKEIPIDQITAIQWRNPSAIFAGHIQFTIMGGSSDSKAGSLDENAMMFNGSQVAEFRRLKAEVEKRMAVFRRARLGGHPAPIAQPDVADQLRKLGELRDLGLVTEEEFNAKKTDLLSRM